MFENQSIDNIAKIRFEKEFALAREIIHDHEFSFFCNFHELILMIKLNSNYDRAVSYENHPFAYGKTKVQNHMKTIFLHMEKQRRKLNPLCGKRATDLRLCFHYPSTA